MALEDQAKSQGVGKWSKDPETNHIRSIKYNIDNPSNFVDSFRQKPIDGRPFPTSFFAMPRVTDSAGV